MTKILHLLLLALLLSACDRNDVEAENDDSATSPPPAAATTAVETQELAGSDREALREALDDPAQREALIQSLRERRDRQSEGERAVDREALRERMRERRAEMMGGEDEAGRRERLQQRQMAGAGEWWTHPAMSENLGLSTDQQQALSSAHQALEAERAQQRERLAATQQEMMQAVRGGQRDQLEALIEQRSQAMQAGIDLDARWQHQLLATLTDEQLEQLATRNPQLLLGRGRAQVD